MNYTIVLKKKFSIQFPMVKSTCSILSHLPRGPVLQTAVLDRATPCWQMATQHRSWQGVGCFARKPEESTGTRNAEGGNADMPHLHLHFFCCACLGEVLGADFKWVCNNTKQKYSGTMKLVADKHFLECWISFNVGQQKSTCGFYLLSPGI